MPAPPAPGAYPPHPLSWLSRVSPMASFCTPPHLFFSEGERVCLAAGGNFRAAGSVGLIKIKPSF